MADLGQIIEALVQRTERGNLAWVETAEPNGFVASVGAVSVVVRDLSETPILLSITKRSGIQLEILNARGETAEIVSSGETWGWSPYPSAEERQAQNLEQLYALARRAARGAQDTLDELARGLGIT